MTQGLWVRKLIEQALHEDLPFEDLTTYLIVPENELGTAFIISKADGIVCGLTVAQMVFEFLNPSVRFSPKVEDAGQISNGMVIAEVYGNLRTLLMGERTALNFLQRLSGISSLTKKFVDKVSGFGVKISDTRKTTPTLRLLEKYAVRCGGGINHRFSLSDWVLIKDNHVLIAGSIAEAVKRVKKKPSHLLLIEVEAQTINDVREALECDVDAIMLDNMTVEQIYEAVQLVNEWCKQNGKMRPVLEASGKISLDNVISVAQAGVDIISIGALTHSAPALDISMEILR